MPDQVLPESLKRRFKVRTVEELWQKKLTEGNIRSRRYRHIYGMLPSNPRCVNCHRPFAGPGGAVLRITQGVRKSDKNPRFCTGCYGFTTQFPGGAEIELTMLFVDAFIDKLVGDEVTALFIPGFAGEKHARRAVKAGQDLLDVTGHGDPAGPWVPVGVGIHTGIAWVGSIAGASGAAADFTALGDNVNIAARLASAAGQGEVLISEATYNAAQVENETLERRELELKGKSDVVPARVLKIR